MSDRSRHPDAFARRISDLRVRGVDPGLADELWAVGDGALVAELERATDADLAAINAEWRAR